MRRVTSLIRPILEVILGGPNGAVEFISKKSAAGLSMTLGRIREALNLAIRLHKGQTWPGSRIPYVAHALEVACRVAALGGEEDTVLAALLHEARYDHDEVVTLQEIRHALGDRVAGLLDTCWTQNLLPHAGWDAWKIDAGAGVDDPEIQLVIACDALCCFRNILLDWQDLAHMWDEAPPEDPSDRLWIMDQARIPEAVDLTRSRWVRKEMEDPSESEVRRELLNCFRSWMTLPIRHPERITPFPSLTLAHQGNAWVRWVDGQELVPRLRVWGLHGIAQEMSTMLGNLSGLPRLAQAGFLRRSAQRGDLLKPEVVVECLRKMTMVELMLIVVNRRSKLVCSFRKHVPKHLQDLFSAYQFGPEQASLSNSILLYWLGEVAMEGRVLDLPPMGNCKTLEPVDEPSPFPSSGRYETALTLAFEGYAEERWPATTIPYIYHPLEVSSLALTAGWDEDTAILALLHDLPRAEDSLDRVGESLGPATKESLRHYWCHRGLVHRAPGACPIADAQGPIPKTIQAVAWMDATSLLRFVAEDYQAMGEIRTLHNDLARHELAKRFQFFRGFLYGRTLWGIADTVLIGTRFGASLRDWQKALECVKPNRKRYLLHDDAPLGEGSEELATLMSRLAIPLPEILGLACTLECMETLHVYHLLEAIGLENAATAFQDANWEPVWKVVQAKLTPLQVESLDEQIRSQPQDVQATKKAQTTILAMITRMRRVNLLR